MSKTLSSIAKFFSISFGALLIRRAECSHKLLYLAGIDHQSGYDGGVSYSGKFKCALCGATLCAQLPVVDVMLLSERQRPSLPFTRDSLYSCDSLIPVR